VIIPSAVGIDSDGNFITGEPARARYLLEPENTAIEIKRKIGTSETIRLGSKEYTPIELSAKLLQYVREYASSYLNEDVTRAVISVPAYFDEIQRQATVEAGRLAGFQVERIINEPTAAALSYGLEHLEEESHILVYDLGGGTFDVTLLEMFAGVLEVKASSGDNKLGGKDFDECIIDYLIREFKAKHDCDLRNNRYAMVKLKEQAEWCKKELSTQDSCRITIPFIAEINGAPVALDETISRETFEGLIRELVDRTHHPIDVVLSDSGLLPTDIDRILLVGGSTRIPLISRDIEEYLGIAPSSCVDPDYAVSQGAAIMAGMLAGDISDENSLIMTDVNPYTLGVRTFNGLSDDCMTVVIPRNVTIPVIKTEAFRTSFDDQTAVLVKAYQGESPVASENHFLGEFELSGIPMKPAGQEKVDISFSYNLNGMLDVSAVIRSTGESASVSINMLEHAGQASSEERMDVSGWKESPLAAEYRSLIRKAERTLKHLDAEDDPFYHDDLDETLYLLKLAILQEDSEEAADMEEELMDILGEL
jgi:molecular chaperone DnaK